MKSVTASFHTAAHAICALRLPNWFPRTRELTDVHALMMLWVTGEKVTASFSPRLSGSDARAFIQNQTCYLLTTGWMCFCVLQTWNGFLLNSVQNNQMSYNINGTNNSINRKRNNRNFREMFVSVEQYHNVHFQWTRNEYWVSDTSGKKKSCLSLLWERKSFLKKPHSCYSASAHVNLYLDSPSSFLSILSYLG